MNTIDKKSNYREQYRKRTTSIKTFLDEEDKVLLKEMLKEQKITMQEFVESYIKQELAKYKEKE